MTYDGYHNDSHSQSGECQKLLDRETAMKAFLIDRYGKDIALRLGDVPRPMPRDNEVLIEVHAAGVNLLDSKIKSGEFKLILPLPPAARTRS